MRGVLLGLFFGIIWWVLTEGAQAWAVGIPVVLLVTYLACRLQPAPQHRLHLRYLPAFAWFFITRSVSAGIDVGKRTLSPRLKLNPGFYSFHTQLPSGAPQYFFGAVVSLLPGTLCSEFTDHTIVLHVLDTDDDIERDSRALEQQIARLYGVRSHA